jgi:hypothetical protein
MTSKEEWLDWKQNDITKAFYQACKERANDAKDILAGSAGIDPINDNFYRGFIAAYSEMTEFRVEDVEE